MSYTHATYMLPLSPTLVFMLPCSVDAELKSRVLLRFCPLPLLMPGSILNLHMISEQTRVTQGPGACPSSQGVQMACLTSQGEYENRVSWEFSVPNLTSVAGLSGYQRAILGHLPQLHLLL